MNLAETIRYATFGAAAALLVSGGIYAGSAFQAQRLNTRAGDGYAGNFDYVQKEGDSGSAPPATAGTGSEPSSAAPQSVPAVTEDDAQAAPPDPLQESGASSDTVPSAAAAEPTPAAAAESVDDAEPGEDAEPPAAGDPAPAAEPATEPAGEQPATDPTPEPGGAGVTPGPAILKAINPCLLVKCDPPPPPRKLTLDPCLVNQCAVAEDEPVFVPPIDYSKLPSLQLDLR